MGKSQETYNKKEREKKRLKKRMDKKVKAEERKRNSKGGGLDNMMAYVDEEGNIVDTPPDPTKKKKIKAENIEIGIPRREEEDVDPIRKGRIEYFNDAKGYGFIRETGTGEKFFVHISGLIDDVGENEMVIFEIERGMKGFNAVRVKKA